MTQEEKQTGNSSPTEPPPASPRPETPEPKSLKEYFDEQLNPHLSAALAACARERPSDPVEFVGKFLLNACGKSS
jgi:hypothetical protein